MTVTVKVHASGKAVLPAYQSAGAAGADVCACIDSPITIKPGERILVSTGLKMEIPEGYEVQVRPRSGLALKFGITVLNSPGTIDSDYRGELGVVLINHGHEDFIVHNGDRIAQMVVAPVVRAAFVPESSLSETERGSGGYGSTGRK